MTAVQLVLPFPQVRKGHKVPYAGSLRTKWRLLADGCWEWLGAVASNGYGSIKVDGKARAAHRVVFERVLKRAVDPEKDLHHVCGLKRCVNPAHLQEVRRVQHNRSHWNKRKLDDRRERGLA